MRINEICKYCRYFRKLTKRDEEQTTWHAKVCCKHRGNTKSNNTCKDWELHPHIKDKHNV